MTKLIVSNMKCMGCVHKIEDILKTNSIEADVKLEDKTVTINEADANKAKTLIKSIGYLVKE